MLKINKNEIRSIALKLSVAILILIIITGLVIIGFEYLSMLIKGQNFDYRGSPGKYFADKVYRIFWLLVLPLSIILILAPYSNVTIDKFKLKMFGKISAGLGLVGAISTTKPVPSAVYIVLIPYLLFFIVFFTYNWYPKAMVAAGLMFILPTFAIGLQYTANALWINYQSISLYPILYPILSVLYGLICITLGYRFRGGIT